MVNYEIVNYDSTDVVGVAEELPFKDNSFDAVISVAVLEHVRDPFRAAREIARVLKPGGKLFCCVPFLQAFHGYPNHYYNMTYAGLANLFPDLKVLQQAVYPSTGPIHTLVWFFRNWLDGLEGKTREDFLDMRVRDLIDDPWSYLDRPFVTEVPEAVNFAIASATILIATKEAAPARGEPAGLVEIPPRLADVPIAQKGRSARARSATRKIPRSEQSPRWAASCGRCRPGFPGGARHSGVEIAQRETSCCDSDRINRRRSPGSNGHPTGGDHRAATPFSRIRSPLKANDPDAQR